MTIIESAKNENGIQTLSRQDSETRKVNQRQEINLRHLIRKLYSENKLKLNFCLDCLVFITIRCTLYLALMEMGRQH